MDMKEKREIAGELAEFLSYKVRSGQLSQEAGEKIWKLAMQKPEMADAITNILDMELPEEETVLRVERLI
ncbi:MAG: hypothetical protein PUG78_05015 [Eubacteriales bacterium]|nr:hypothetical protein [Clostridiales bacterium]MDD7307755.1 hypothetical protein [Eubacteriales bacterium]MDY2934341.1 hypothetical protein [Anaerovoracaceae bacterium]